MSLFKTAQNNIYMTRGDSAVFHLEILDSNGSLYEAPDGTSLLFTVKSDTETTAIILQKSVIDGSITINPSDTSALDYGDYVYDVQMVLPDGYTSTIIPPSLFRLMQEVTFQ
jgi:hypothetical protein